MNDLREKIADIMERSCFPEGGYEPDAPDEIISLCQPQWISVEDRLPEPETPVFACVHGIDFPIVLNLVWETCNPMIESCFKDFLYWDDPNNDGQDFEDRVYSWQPLPDLPEESK